MIRPILLLGQLFRGGGTVTPVVMGVNSISDHSKVTIFTKVTSGAAFQSLNTFNFVLFESISVRESLNISVCSHLECESR